MAGKKKEAKEKPLDRMTAKELRDMAKEIPEITGVYGMNKEELVSAVKQARGIVEEGGRSGSSSVRELKVKIREFKAKREAALQAEDPKMADVWRKRIIRLKKRSRRLA